MTFLTPTLIKLTLVQQSSLQICFTECCKNLAMIVVNMDRNLLTLSSKVLFFTGPISTKATTTYWLCGNILYVYDLNLPNLH